MKNIYFFVWVALNIFILWILCFQSFLYFTIDHARIQLQNTHPDDFARIPTSNISNPYTSTEKPLYTKSFIQDAFCIIKNPVIKDIKSWNLVLPKPQMHRRIWGKLLLTVDIELPNHGKMCTQNYQFISLLLKDNKKNNFIVHTYRPKWIGCSPFESDRLTPFSELNIIEEKRSQDWYNTIDSSRNSFYWPYYGQPIGSMFQDVVVDSDYRILYIPDKQVFQENSLDKDVFLQQLPLCPSL